MRRVALLAPRPLDARTGGSIYNLRIVQGLERRGWRVDIIPLDESFPSPLPAACDEAGRVLATLSAGTIAILDSLALGAMPGVIAAARPRLRIVALMHLPLAADCSREPTAAARFEAGERIALGAASLVIITGAAALPLLSRYGLPPHRVHVVEPGTDPAPLARGSQGGAVELLCVATLNPIKGHDVLLEALARVPHDDSWHLTCAGSLTRDRETAARVRDTIARLDLQARVTLAGELDAPALAGQYDRADAAVLATRQETYGMAVAEALAHGLPVVTTSTGAAPDLVGSEAGLLVPVGDVDALASALSRIVDDEGLRASLAAGARRVRDRLPTWDDAAGRFAAALEGIPEHG